MHADRPGISDKNILRHIKRCLAVLLFCLLFCLCLLRLCLFFFFRHYLCCFAYCNSIGTDTAEIVFFQTIPRHIQQHFSCRCTKRCLRPGCKCRNKKAAQKQNPSAKLSFLHDHIIPVQMLLYKADNICLFRQSAYREILSQ